MSEITRGVIGMPYEMAMGSELSRRQFYSIAREVYAESERLSSALNQANHMLADVEAENESLRALLKQANVHVPCNWPLRNLINAKLIISPENL